MICTGGPVVPNIAYYIEWWNLYTNYNRAWMEMSLNMWLFYLPKNYEHQEMDVSK